MRALSFCRFILSRQATEPPAFSIFPRPARLAEPTPIDSNLPRPASSPSPLRQICRAVVNDPKRLKLPLSPPHARPAGAKSTDGHPPDFSATSMLIQPLCNHFPTPIWTESTATQPRLNHPSCRIQKRFRLSHPPFVILQLGQQPNRYSATTQRYEWMCVISRMPWRGLMCRAMRSLSSRSP